MIRFQRDETDEAGCPPNMTRYFKFNKLDENLYYLQSASLRIQSSLYRLSDQIRVTNYFKLQFDTEPRQ